MKSILLVVSFLVAGVANAAINAKEFTCVELQSILERDGQIKIKRALGSTTYYTYPNCNADQVPTYHYEWAKDTWYCRLGWDCMSDGSGGPN